MYASYENMNKVPTVVKLNDLRGLNLKRVLQLEVFAYFICAFIVL